jgi:membrane-associated phospholipid phosphatase
MEPTQDRTDAPRHPALAALVIPLLALLALPGMPGMKVEAQEPRPTPETGQEATGEPEAEEAEEVGRWRRTGRTMAKDFGSLYAPRPLIRIGGALLVGGALANTSGDQEIQDWYTEDVRSESTDDLAADVKVLGDTWVAPTFVLLGLVGELAADGPPGSAGSGVTGWARRTGRATIIGLPSVYYLQQITGGNRPSDGLGSDWEFFDGSHGVSGHTFLGAVPFLALARQSDNAAVDTLAILASTLAGWARLNDDQHYFSQVLLGWYLAWEATGAVERSHLRATGEDGGLAYSVTPVALPDGGGLTVTMSF